MLGPYEHAEMHSSAKCEEFLVLLSYHQLLEKDNVSSIVTSSLKIYLGSSGFE